MENEIIKTTPTYEELVIDAERRKIRVPKSEVIFGVETDTEAEVKHFRCPRYVGKGLDLAACIVRVHYRNANGETDAYIVQDVVIDGTSITFSWALSKKVTKYKGRVQFAICAVMSAGLPEWNTTLAEGLVLEGLEPDSSTVEEETADVIAQLLGIVTAQTAAVEAVGAEQVALVKTAAGDLIRDRAAAIVCEAEGATVQVNDSSADPLIGLRIFGKSAQNGTPTPATPVDIVSLKAPVLRVSGANLIPYPYADGEVKTTNGITFTVRPDGSVLVNGTATGSAFFNFNTLANSIHLPRGWLCASTGAGYGPGVVHIQNDIYMDGVYITSVQTVTEGTSRRQFESGEVTLGASRLKVDAGTTVSNVIVYPILSNTETPVPYARGAARQVFNITTPTNLPGIPVASGGNYTDANGQQWIADEVDLARGVYVQRCGALASYAGESIPGQYISTTGQLTTGAKVLYVLATPTETPLSAEEIGAFRALLANKPTTTVMNDAGAWMALEYAADPKLYIDNKIAALAANK